jgi:hypothetical protein
MIFSGNNYLSLNYQTGLSFSVDLNFNNISGFCELGFSGSNPSSIPKEKISYIFDKSKIYDPEGRLVYFYKENEYINLSGSINPTAYSYYIDGNLLCSNGNKNNFNLNKFYLNTSGCQVDTDLTILGDIPKYNINFNKFNVSGILTGSINNNSLSQFKIYSGTITNLTGFAVNTINLEVLTGILPSYITINTFDATKNQINDNTKYSINLNLYTNFGLISKSYDIIGSFIKDIQTILNLNQGFDFDIINSIIGINEIKNQEYNLNFYIKSGTNYSLPKNLSLNLEYFGGTTGLFYQDILSTGVQNIVLTGLITGSGILSKTLSMSATGYDFLSNLQKTGYITGVAQNLFFATGFNSTSGSLSSTGFFNGNLIYKNISFNKSGYSINGINDYSNSFINDYYFYENKLLTGSNSNNDFLFGSNIACNSDHSILAVSAPSGNIGNCTGAGLVYIFTGSSNWIQTAILSGSDANTGDNFGYSLSMNNNGTILAVGSPNKNLGTGIDTYTGAGAVYIFNKNGINWTQSAIITGSGSNARDKFGHSLELSQNGNVLIVGSPNKNIGTGVNTYTGVGMAHLFSIQSDVWTPLVQITGTGALSQDGFGHSVSLSNDGYTVAIGATGRDVGSYTNLGSVYLFKADQFNFPAWQYNARLTGSNSSAEDNLGYRVKVNNDGTIILASSINNNSKAGHVYVFTGDMFNSVPYRQSQRLQPSDLSAGDNFGYSLTINNNGNLLCVSSPYDSYSSLISGGSCYIFEKNNSYWTEKQKITGNLNYTQNYNKFGSLVCFNNLGTNLLVGSELFDSGSYNNIGSVYTFKSVDFTGYLGEVTGTGIVSYDSILFATGNITGSTYNKTFLDVFDMQTGYYVNNQLTGIKSFKTGNFILNQSYKSSGIIDPSINFISLSIKTKNYPDNQAITGKLTISGYDNTNNYSSVIINYITGKR